MILVRKIRRMTEGQVANTVQGFLSIDGTCTALPDGLIVVGDRLEVVARVSDVFDRIDSAPSVVWCVQLHVISLTEKDLLDLGLDVNPALELAAGYANLSNVTRDLTSGAVQGLRGEGGSSVADASLSAVLRATRERKSMSVVTDPLFTLIEGSEGLVVRGLKIPVRTSVVTGQNGNVANSIQWVQTGLEGRASVREVSEKLGRLKLSLDISDVTNVSSDLGPTTDQQKFSCEVDCEVGGVYLLGSLRRGKRERSQGAFLSIGAKNNTESEVWLIYSKLYRVAKSLY